MTPAPFPGRALWRFLTTPQITPLTFIFSGIVVGILRVLGWG